VFLAFEAAAIIEAMLAGAKLLLIDEDSSATNILIKDHNMRKLLPKDTITPIFLTLFRSFINALESARRL
jgi:predicted ABC-class ATPase